MWVQRHPCALALGQRAPVHDGRVVQCIGNYRVVRAQDGFEQAAIRIETGGVEDRVVGAEEFRNGLLKLLVSVKPLTAV